MMAKKNNKQTKSSQENTKSAADYYKLNTKAVEKMVEAKKGNTPKYTEEELNKYRSKSGIRLPKWLKVIFVKLWFAGAVCFFIFWGLGIYVADMLDMMLVFGIALGVVTDLLTNGVLRNYAETPDESSRWMMIPQKKLSCFFLNILYAFWLLFCVFNVYQVINGTFVMITGQTDIVLLGVEPVLFGLFYTCTDLIFIHMKKILIIIWSDAKKNA